MSSSVWAPIHHPRLLIKIRKVCNTVGGVCSPLLANIALHGLEEAITAAFPQFSHGERWKPTVVRYADDFVVLHPDKPATEQVQQLAQTWLAGMGLTLKPSKTHITHTLNEEEAH